MARRFTCGFETPYYSSASSEIDATRSEANTYLTPGRCGGYAFTIDHASTGINYQYEHDIRDIDGGSAGAALEPSYSRFYLRIRQYPAAGGSPEGTTFWGVMGSGDILKSPIPSSVYGVVMSDGTLNFYSKGDSTIPMATNLIGTVATPLALNTWYRINIYLKFNTIVDSSDPQASDAAMTVHIDGSLAFSFAGASPQQFAFGINDEANDGTWFYAGVSNQQTGLNGGIIDVDDWVIDDAVAPDEGFVTLHRPVAAGTYSEWTTNGFRSVRALPENVDTDLASSGASARISFQVESLASKGVTGTIKSVRVAGRVLAARDDWTFGLRQNGVDNYNPAAVTGSTAPIGWLVDSGTLMVSPADTLEIIVRDGSGAGVDATMDFACLVVDVEQAAFDPQSLLGDAIQVYEGTFVGTGALQDISVPFAIAAEPDLIIVKPDNAGGVGGWWHRGMGDRGDRSLAIADITSSPIAWVDSNSFTVRQSAGVNDSGETNRFIVVSDPSRRMSIPAKFSTFNTAGQEDGRTVAFSDTNFVPVALFIDTLLSGTNAMFYRGPGHTGDSSSRIDQDLAAAADQVQSFATGGFTAGIGVQFAQTPYGCYALRTASVFTDNILCEVGSYTGDDAASRDIPLALTGASAAGFVMVVPHNTGIRCCRFGSQAGTGSYRWSSATLNTTTGITAFDVDSFTVTTGAVNLNAAGVIYDYVVFGVGIDAEFTGVLSVAQAAAAIASVGYFGFTGVGAVAQAVAAISAAGALLKSCNCHQFIVPFEDRFMGIVKENRFTFVAVDDRNTEIEFEDRYIDVFPDSRLELE